MGTKSNGRWPKRDRSREDGRGGGHVKTEAEVGGMWPSAQECQRHQEPGEAGRILPQSFQGRRRYLPFGCLASGTVRKYISIVLRHQICSNLLTAAIGRKCRSKGLWVAEVGLGDPEGHAFTHEWSTLGWMSELLRKPHYSRISILFWCRVGEEGDAGRKNTFANFFVSGIKSDTLNSACSFVIRVPVLNRKERRRQQACTNRLWSENKIETLPDWAWQPNDCRFKCEWVTPRKRKRESWREVIGFLNIPNYSISEWTIYSSKGQGPQAFTFSSAISFPSSLLP